MLLKLSVKDFALIEDIDIDFHSGLSALTGETGAGKSIILEALELLFGKRSDSQMIRHGKSQARVFGLFKLSRKVQLISGFPETIEISRTIDENGRHTVRVNNEIQTLQKLRETMQYVGSIHSQDDAMQLYDKDAYLKFIDDMDRKAIEPLYTNYLMNRSYFLDAKKAYEKGHLEKVQEEKQLDFFEFQLKELKSYQLKQGEKEELDEKIEKLKHFDKTVQALKNTRELLDSSNLQLDNLYEASKQLKTISFLDKVYEENQEKLMDTYYEIDAIRSSIEDALNMLDFDESEFNLMQERSHELSKIELKYKMTIDELLVYQKDLEDKILKVNNFDAYIEGLKKRMDDAFKKAFDSGEKLSQMRKRLAKVFEKKIVEELKRLDLDKAEFKINFENLEASPDILFENGIDRIDFEISLNEGEPVKSLSKVASGGEKSRFMLALKTIHSLNEGLSILVLDEIDTGVSGKTAAKVAQKMKELSKDMQVIVITHLPQVAAKADYQYAIYKVFENNRMVTKIDLLTEEARIKQIGMMLSDDSLSSFALEQAKMLLSNK